MTKTIAIGVDVGGSHVSCAACLIEEKKYLSACGGAVLPLLMGWISDLTGNVTSAMMVLVAAISTLLFVSLISVKAKT